MTASPNPDPATTLCTSCGLCCDGYLHSHVVLDPAEIARAEQLGLPLLTDGRLGFRLPCPKLTERSCSIYRERPGGCSGYKCRLLYDLEEDRVTLSAALQRVVAARDMAAAFELDRLSESAPTLREESQRTLRRTTFRLFLDKYFRNRHEGPMVRKVVVGGDEKDERQ